MTSKRIELILGLIEVNHFWSGKTEMRSKYPLKLEKTGVFSVHIIDIAPIRVNAPHFRPSSIDFSINFFQTFKYFLTNAR